MVTKKTIKKKKKLIGPRDLTLEERDEIARNIIVRRYIIGLLALIFMFILTAL